jgi:hypothetical protein
LDRHTGNRDLAVVALDYPGLAIDVLLTRLVGPTHNSSETSLAFKTPKVPPHGNYPEGDK